ncbi:putative retrotransposon protein [Tanacetum coccineum]
MKESSLMLTLLIPGPKSLGTERCNEDTPSMRVLSKTAYVGHKRFIKKPHKWRRSLDINGETEDKDPPRKFTWAQILTQLERLPTHLRGDQGLESSKNSTRSPREITLLLLLYLIVHKPHLYPFDYRVTIGFGSIAGGLDPVGPVIRLPIERGINSGTRIEMSNAGQPETTIDDYLTKVRDDSGPGIEPFNESLRARLSRYPVEPNVFLEVILYLADLALSWEGSPLHPANFIDGQEMTQQDFLHYPGNHHVTNTADPVSAPLPVGSPDVPVANTSSEDANILGVKGTSVAACSAPRGIMDAPTFVGSSFKGKKIIGSSAGGLKKRRFEDLDGVASSPVFVRRRIRFVGPLASSKENVDSDPFLQANFHDVFALKFMMFNTMLNKEVHSLSVEASRIRDENFRLGGKKSKSTATIARLEAELLGVGGKFLAHEVGFIPDLKAENKKLTEDFKTELEALKEKLDLANEDRSLMVTDLLPHVVKTLLSRDYFSFQLENIKDYDLNAMEAYDKAVDDFYHVEFPYLDLLAYHLRRSLGFLKSLEPPSLPLHKSLGAGRMPLTMYSIMGLIQLSSFVATSATLFS